MLVLKRKEGQWIEITHKSGDTLRVRVYNIRARFPNQLDLAFEDDARNFEIQRPDRAPKPDDPAESGTAPEGAAPLPLRPLAHCLSRLAAEPGRIRRSS